MIDTKTLDVISILDSIIKLAFSIPFAAFGLFIGSHCFNLYYEVAQMKAWIATPATVVLVAKDIHGNTDMLRKSGEVDITLQCAKRTFRGSGRDGVTRGELELWSQVIHPGGADAIDAPIYTLPVQFDIPNDQPATEFDAGGDKVFWRLRVKAKTSGPDLDVTFYLPVFAVV